MMRINFTLLLTLFALNFSSGQAYWESLGMFPSTGRHGTCSFTLNGYGYSIGGALANTQISNEVWQFDPSNESWTLLPTPFPVTIFGATAFVIGDTAYVCNGWMASNGNANSVLYKYDAVNEVWDTAAYYPGTPAYTTMSFVLNGKAYVGVGYNPYTNEVWQYDPDSALFTQKADLPSPLRQNATAFVVNNRAFAGLGATNGGAYDYFYEYIDSTDSWDSAFAFPGGVRYAASCLVINDKAYIGCGSDLALYYNDFWEFDPLTMNWTQMPDYGGNIRHEACDFVINNIGYVGLGRSSVYENDFWKFIPSGLNEIRGVAYYDVNGDSVKDSTESGTGQLLIEISPGGAIYSTNSQGIFKAPADTAISYTFNVLNIPDYYTIGNLQNPVIFNGTGMIDSSTSFALVPTGTVNDLKLDLTQLSPIRPGFEGIYTLTYQNKGTVATDTAIVSLYLDSGLTFVSLEPAPANYSVSGDTISWDVYDIIPGETRYLNARYTTGFNYSLGDTVITTATILPVINDNVPADNYSTAIDTVVGSFDPNDKLVSKTSLTPQEVLNGEWLTYTIRFQNTGTYQANYVRIIDSLPSSLNLATFEMLSSSHPSTFVIEGNNIIKWNFPGIVLPDSNTNEVGSHGFVKFRIKANTNLVLGDEIHNNAGIYFDFNPPVITDYAVTIVESITSVEPVESKGNEFLIYPNPASGSIKIELKNLKYIVNNISIYSVNGILMERMQSPDLNNILLNKLPAGFYIIELQAENGHRLRASLVKQ